MRFEPKSEAQVSGGNLLPTAVYDFEIVDATETSSQSSGNDMIALKVKVYTADGASHRTVFDYLVDGEKSAYKVRHCAAAVGLIEHYERGELPADILIGRTGRCKVALKHDPSGQYPDNNQITDYLPEMPKTKGDAFNRQGGAPPMLDDEIPFAPDM